MAARTDLTALALTRNSWPTQEIDGLTLIRSPLLLAVPSLVHAFTTRLGGNSAPPLDSFNLGRHWGTQESRKDALHNRQRLCAALEMNFNRLVVPGQVHSTNVAWVTEPEHLGSVDGVATVSPDTPVMLHYADCVPIVIAEPNLPALAVVHAGWRGTAGGIAGKAVRLLSEALAIDPDVLLAAVGPAIGSCCYPTGIDVAEQLLSSVQHKAGLVRWHDDRPYPDLKAINAMQLLEAGLERIDVASWCTACHPDLFYSHRRFAGKTGRQSAIASIVARP
ncbi:MAG TPA: peptidoglycan editing factor PgeF [Candidatus Obscuribacterales bacterium]